MSNNSIVKANSVDATLNFWFLIYLSKINHFNQKIRVEREIVAYIEEKNLLLKKADNKDQCQDRIYLKFLKFPAISNVAEENRTNLFTSCLVFHLIKEAFAHELSHNHWVKMG